MIQRTIVFLLAVIGIGGIGVSCGPNGTRKEKDSLKESSSKVQGQENSVKAFRAQAEQATSPPRIPLRQFFDNPQRAGAQLSSDGKRLAFLQPWKHRLNIWVTDLPEGGNHEEAFEKAYPITQNARRGITRYAWTRDDRFILYAQDEDGNEDTHLYRVDPYRPEIKPVDLTPFPGVKAGLLDFPRERPDEMLITLNRRDQRFHDVYRVQISTGEMELVAQNPGDVNGWYVDWDGKVLAAMAKVGKGETEVRVRQAEQDDFRILARYSMEEAPTLWGFDSQGAFLYMESSKGSNTSRLVKLDIASGEETEVLASDPEYDFGSALFREQDRKLIGVTFQREKKSYVPLDKLFKKDLEILSQFQEGDLFFLSSDEEERKWVVAYQSPVDPGAVYLYDRETGKISFLYRPRPWLPSEHLAPMLPVAFPSRDGLMLHGYLTLPPGKKSEKLPLILNVHGGPWARDAWGYDGEVQFLANRGYAVLQLNFRGSIGYGKAFVEAGNQQWGAKMMEDLVDSVHWAVDQGIADPQRLAISGGSFGGYATLAALAFHPDIFAAGIDMVGVSNLFTLMESIPPYWETFRETMYRRIGHPEKDKDLLRAHSPLFHADRIRAPLLIAHGANDPRVKLAETNQIVAALEKNGQPYELLVKEDEGHGFANPENRMEFYERVEAFLEKHVRNRSEE